MMPSSFFIGTKLMPGYLDLHAGEEAWWLLGHGGTPWANYGLVPGRGAVVVSLEQGCECVRDLCFLPSSRAGRSPVYQAHPTTSLFLLCGIIIINITWQHQKDHLGD